MYSHVMLVKCCGASGDPRFEGSTPASQEILTLGSGIVMSKSYVKN